MELAANGFFRSVLCAGLDIAPAQRDLDPGKAVYFFANAGRGAMIVRIATLSNAGTPGNISFCRDSHSHDLRSSEELNCKAIRSPAIHEQLTTFPYPHHFVAYDDVPETLGDCFTSGFHAKDTRAMHAVGQSPSSHQASSLGSHPPELAAVQNDSTIDVKTSIDHDTTGKDVAVPRP